MICRRRIARERRGEQRGILKSWALDLRYEGLFEYALLKSARGEAVMTGLPKKGKSLERHSDRCAGEIAQLISKEDLPWAPVYTGKAKANWGERYILFYT